MQFSFSPGSNPGSSSTAALPGAVEGRERAQRAVVGADSLYERNRRELR